MSFVTVYDILLGRGDTKTDARNHVSRHENICVCIRWRDSSPSNYPLMLIYFNAIINNYILNALHITRYSYHLKTRPKGL
jgi:hypothetical protein